MANQTTLQQYLDLGSEKKIIILNPMNRGGNYLLLKHLCDHDQLIFLDCTLAEKSLQDLHELLAAALDDQSNLRPQELLSPLSATAAAALLAQQGKNLMLESYDSLNSVADSFVLALAAALPEGVHVLLNGRNIPNSLLEQSPLCQSLPINPDEMLLDYANAQGEVILEVRALGPGQATINGRNLENWDGVLPKSLFFYFVDRGMVTRESIFETFWDGMARQDATNVFHVTKRKISEILKYDLTTYGSGYYRIADNIVLHYDVAKLREAVDEAEVLIDTDEDGAIELYQRAIRLYRGDFLCTQEQAWVVERREELHQTYADALLGLGHIYHQRGKLSKALGLYNRAWKIMREREDLVRDIMQIYIDLQEYEQALETFQRFAEWLKRNMGVEPSAETLQLAEHVRSLLLKKG